MDVTTLPFNRLLGLEKAPVEIGFLVFVPDSPKYTNHLGTVHAGVLLAVAEGGSAEFLLRHLGNPAGVVPVVRRLEAKFRKPARGRVSARASVNSGELERCSAELKAKGRVSIPVPVEVVDESGKVALSAVVEWFIARTDGTTPL
jgi:acyl-coenzyme A thioesterase PaaI-like protein